MDERFAPERLHGTWALVSAKAFGDSGDVLRPPYGPQPMGRLVLASNGRMMAVLCDGRPTISDGEQRAYASYCGNYRIEDDRLITRVDAALIPERIGGEQVRRLEWEGDDLVLIPPRRADGEQRDLVWRRIAGA